MTNITAMFRTRYAAAVPLLMLLVAIAAGCSSVSDEETATDLLGISTSWPTIKYGLEADYRLFVLAWSEQVCRSCAETHLGYFNQYIATYVASQCDSGGKLTSKGFRDFLDETFGLVKLGIRARDTLQNMNGLAEGRIKAGLTPVTDDCQRLILYPESGLEVALAQGLYSAGLLSRIPFNLRDDALRTLERLFSGWLLVEDNQQRTIFRWFCETNGCEVGVLP